MDPPSLLNEAAFLRQASPTIMDAAWSQGWRHFGEHFFRYSHSPAEDGSWLHILPLRLNIANFQPTPRLRRILRRNADLTLEIGPARVDDAREALFQRHRQRFHTNIPDSLRQFLPSPDPASLPCECREIRLLEHGQLLALSYLDLGQDACSSVYALFEPAAAHRSLGFCTLLHEIEFARHTGRRFLYPGYATLEPSPYDYKKTLPALEAYSWASQTWLPLDRIPALPVTHHS